MSPGFLDQMLDKVSNLEGMYAYGTIFAFLFGCGIGFPMPEDIILVVSGYLSYLENIDLLTTNIVCVLGVLTGDLILFMLGKIYGKRILQLPLIKYVVTPTRLAYATEKIKKNGRLVCFLARFLAGLRAPVYLSAGMAGIKFSTFILLDGFAALISVPLWIYLGFRFGDEIDLAFHYARRAEKYILLALALIGIYFLLKRALRKNAGSTDQI